MAENPYKVISTDGLGNVKNISDAIKKANETTNDEGVNNGETANSSYSSFKVTKTTLPEKTSFWTKLKNALFYDVKIELTPYQQKIEDEINEFLHQEITWRSLKEAALSEVPITFRGKRIF